MVISGVLTNCSAPIEVVKLGMIGSKVRRSHRGGLNEKPPVRGRSCVPVTMLLT